MRRLASHCVPPPLGIAGSYQSLVVVTTNHTMANNQTDWRALCAELHYWVIELAASHPNLSESGITKINEITDRTAAAFSQPEPEVLTDHELLNLGNDVMGDCLPCDPDLLLAFARAAIAADRSLCARLALAQPEPVGPTDEEIEREAIVPSTLQYR